MSDSVARTDVIARVPALAVGTHVGVYQIVAPIGAGGMGEVYRAHDTKLGRDVAIKILPPTFASDPDRLARFEREARLLAALNHPSIAHVYGLEDSSGIQAIVMELIEGETLADRLARGPIALADALHIARQIAEALASAHEQGIVHRDLKPANVKLRPDGSVKVLDFGLAKWTEPVTTADAMNSPTLSARGTQQGLILGTAAYMSPEQASGQRVDRRTDLWSFGVVVFEMLTGRRVFDGDTVSHVIAAVLKSEPDWSALPSGTPGSIHRLLRRCLVKDQRQRLDSASAAVLELEDSAAASPSSATDATAADGRFSRTTRERLAWSIAAILLVAVVAVALRTTRTAPSRVARLSIVLGEHEELAAPEAFLAVSPSGTLVAYVGTNRNGAQLYLRAIDTGETKPLPGTEGAGGPFFSPDGQWIGFFSQGKLKKTHIASGTTEIVCDAPGGRGGTWDSNDQIYFAATNISGISKVSAVGGTPTQVTRLDRTIGEVSHRWPQVLPGGHALIFTAWTGPGREERQVYAQRLDTGERRVVAQSADTGRYLTAGYVVYAREDELFAVPFDADKLQVTGPATRLSEAVRVGAEGAQYDVSNAGDLVFFPGSPERYERQLVWVGRDGTVDPLPAPPRQYANPSISPDGRQAAVNLDAGGRGIGIWIYDFSRATLTPLRTGSGSSQTPVWTPDGKRIVYRATRSGFRNLWWTAVDNTTNEERLTSGDNMQTPASWSPNGQWLVYMETGPTTTDLRMLPMNGDRQPRVVDSTPFAHVNPRLSPDGKWLAFSSAESGRQEVFVQPFPGPGARTLISTGGGIEPVWSHTGRELFYVHDESTLTVAITTEPTLTASVPKVLFTGRYVRSPNNVAGYDVSADAQRFLCIKPMHPEPPASQIHVVLGWTDELKRLAKR